MLRHLASAVTQKFAGPTVTYVGALRVSGRPHLDKLRVGSIPTKNVYVLGPQVKHAGGLTSALRGLAEVVPLVKPGHIGIPGDAPAGPVEFGVIKCQRQLVERQRPKAISGAGVGAGAKTDVLGNDHRELVSQRPEIPERD